MSIALYNGALGMKAFQSALDVASHNISNVNTHGYKTRRPSFEELLYTRMNTNVDGNHLIGHGVKQERTDLLFSQSGLDQTGMNMDFAIFGDGFFQVEKKGEREFTRDGAFYISVEGNNGFLVTNDGAYVLDKAGNRISLQKDASGSFTAAGLVDKLGVYTFPNIYGLTSVQNSRFTENAISGDAMLMGQGGPNQKTYKLVQGSLEVSSVDLAKQLVDVISFQRGFQLNSRMVQTADAMADLVNNLR